MNVKNTEEVVWWKIKFWIELQLSKSIEIGHQLLLKTRQPESLNIRQLFYKTNMLYHLVIYFLFLLK